MSTISRNTSETSVSFSLAELAKIESDRVREEDAQHARARSQQARELREAEARRRAAEAAKIAAEVEARARREREEAAEKIRLEARERAGIEVARIEAEAKARLEVDNAARAHELSMLRARTEGGLRRRERVLAGLLALALCGSGVGAAIGARRVATSEQDAAELREGHLSLSREREHGRTTELAALDRRHAALRARGVVRDAEEARVTAEAARNAIDTRSLDHGRLRAFSDALDVLETRIETLEKLAALERRHADLAAWAASIRRTEITAAARSAAARAKGTGADEGALRAYERALDQLRDGLAQPTLGKGPSAASILVKGPCEAGDPRCGLNGEAIF